MVEMEGEYHILTVCPAYHAETALLRITYDILQVIDKHEDTILDLSAAFDTIDHQVLLNRLHQRFGFRDLALKVARLDFLEGIPPKFERQLRRRE